MDSVNVGFREWGNTWVMRIGSESGPTPTPPEITFDVREKPVPTSESLQTDESIQPRPVPIVETPSPVPPFPAEASMSRPGIPQPDTKSSFGGEHTIFDLSTGPGRIEAGIVLVVMGITAAILWFSNSPQEGTPPASKPKKK